MYGLNAGYDSRPMNTGGTDTGIIVSGTEKSAFFQQVAVNAEAVSNDWNFNAYALLPVGDTEQKINWFYSAGSLATYGIDAGYNITPDFTASIGYYYQDGDGIEADSSGVLGRVAYEISSGLTAGVNITQDEAFETRISADLKFRFGGASVTAQHKEVQQQPMINALAASTMNRDVRLHDSISEKSKLLEPKVKCVAMGEYYNSIYIIQCDDGSAFTPTKKQYNLLMHTKNLTKAWTEAVIKNNWY